MPVCQYAGCKTRKKLRLVDGIQLCACHARSCRCRYQCHYCGLHGVEHVRWLSKTPQKMICRTCFVGHWESLEGVQTLTIAPAVKLPPACDWLGCWYGGTEEVFWGHFCVAHAYEMQAIRSVIDPHFGDLRELHARMVEYRVRRKDCRNHLNYIYSMLIWHVQKIVKQN